MILLQGRAKNYFNIKSNKVIGAFFLSLIQRKHLSMLECK